MIRSDRHRVSAPAVLAESDRVQNLREHARHFFASTEQADRQRQFDFDDTPLREAAVTHALTELFDGRCAFCSSPFDRQLVPHRFRPAQAAVASDGAVQRGHYFRLAYEWFNLYPACTACSAAQGAKFPVARNRMPLGVPWEELRDEDALLLDPCADDPEQHLVYLPSGEVVAPGERGRVTVDVFALNRSELVGARRQVAADARERYLRIVRAYERGEYEACGRLIEEAYAIERPFAAVYRQFVNQRVQTRRRQLSGVLATTGRDLSSLVGALPTITARRMDEASRRFYGRPESSDLRTEPRLPALPKDLTDFTGEMSRQRTIENRVGTRTFALRHVHIRNFKGLRDVRIDLGGHPGTGRWTVLLGENGVGKTSILQAVAMVLAGPDSIERTGLRPRDVLRQSAEKGFVKVELDGLNYELSLSFDRARRFLFNSDLAVPLAAYGATRLISNKRAKQPKFVTANIENLFDPFVSLARTELWVPEISGSDFEAIARALIRLLGVADDDAYVDRSGAGDLFLVTANSRIALSQLSSGYQAMAAMALDLMRVFLERWGSLEAAEGIVLVDEIEAHLHPRWQMRVVASLRSAFPRVQFVASSHSPLTLRGLRDGEAVVIRRSADGIVIQQDLPPLAGMTVDQLLTSETFGLHSTIDPDVERDFERYYQLLAEYHLEPEETGELAVLRDRLDLRRQLGETRRERIMLEAIDEFLARERRFGADARPAVSENLRARLAALWTQDGP